MAAAKAAPTTPTTLADDMAAFLAAAELEKAPAWRPEPNDVIIGDVIGRRTGHTDEYGDYPILTIRLETPAAIKNDNVAPAGTPVNFHAFHTLAREWVETLDGNPRVAIQYRGETLSTARTAAKGEDVSYHDYFGKEMPKAANN
jgi:hypothetical protein